MTDRVQPGLYKYTHGDYHNLKTPTPCLSSGIAKILIQQSPLHAMAAHPDLTAQPTREEAEHFDIGSIVHGILLENDRSKIVVIDAPDWRTKAAKEVRDQARAERKTPVLAFRMPDIEAMVLACREQLATHKEASNAFTAGDPEVSMVWQEPNGVWCRGRMDWLHRDRPVIDDLKTSAQSADPGTLSRTMFSNGWTIQAAFYLRGLSFLRPMDGEPLFRFVVQETYPPYALSVVSLGPAALSMANAQVEYAISKWGECLASGKFPGYVDRVAYVDLPSWEESRWLEKETQI